MMEIDRPGDPDFMASLARGLAVLRCFADQQGPMTIAEASQRTGLSRPAVRRCLYTLTVLGYAAQDGQRYTLRPKALTLGNAFLSSDLLVARAQPLLETLRDQLHESCSLGVLEEDEVYYVARAEVMRIMSIALRAGSRLPLYATSMGRVLLASLPAAQQVAYLRRTKITALTPHTVTDHAQLLRLFKQIGEEGFAIVDQELELGLRSVAVPVRTASGLQGAMNVGSQVARHSIADLRLIHLPALRKTARNLASIVW